MPVLAERGEYVASEASFYRILAKEGLLTHRSDSKPPTRKKPVELTATCPNQVWTWDISFLLSDERGNFYYLYLFMDIWDRYIVKWAIHDIQSGELSAKILKEACEQEGIQPFQLTLHQDNGGAMISGEFLSAMKSFEISPSYSRPGVCDDNPYSESLFRTMKYRPGYPMRFRSIEDARKWVERFVEFYNNVHRHSAIGYVTPAQRRNGEDVSILKIRKQTYDAARNRHPERWSGTIRNWNRTEIVYLNPNNPGKSRREKAA